MISMYKYSSDVIGCEMRYVTYYFSQQQSYYHFTKHRFYVYLTFSYYRRCQYHQETVGNTDNEQTVHIMHVMIIHNTTFEQIKPRAANIRVLAARKGISLRFRKHW